ncbi:hypothetical protein [Sphingomonas hengshuiensis]|uniref:DUF4189 domain-containing protein n=1 Tax=Sphingomonas hengshuiensis TaxID=1609977 RepID=A0A7U4LGA3_9SPHN|nr:hypothetical protein [Sphingomonas hengshuiensis]AJP73347.1 hypothetical protein TS85_18420 [Sphingomonas hengshuiensis]
MIKQVVFGAALAVAPLLVPAAQAQNAAQNGVLLIYGNDKCPTNDNGEEIVVCQRLDETERFRIPKTLRDQAGRPQATESWAVRSQDALTSGQTGTGSCSTVGAGGQTGCFVRNATRAKADAKARKKAETDLPLP